MAERQQVKAAIENQTRRPARDRVLDAAAELFYREGFRSVGVDTIVARSGVAKMSLYRNFASKDDLVCAFLTRASAHYWLWWDRVTARYPGDAEGQILGLFSSAAHWMARPGFRGCPFINMAIEYRDEPHAGLALVAEQRAEVRRRFRTMVEAGGVADADQVAARLQFLLCGAYATGRSMIDGDIEEMLVGAARAILGSPIQKPAHANGRTCTGKRSAD